MTPYEQAKYYDNYLPFDEKARWIIVSNFAEIWIYDMNARVPEPVKLFLHEIPSKYPLLEFIHNKEEKQITYEEKISVKAGELVGILYDALLKEYLDPSSEQSLKSLNILCVRLVFCLYAEDALIFGNNGHMFKDYLAPFSARDTRRALIALFRILNTKPEDRDPYDNSELSKFPYVNGGLFADENIEIPNFTDEIREVLLTKASDGFNWAEISPTIFGAVFESTLNPQTRHSGGMHYTSMQNLSKVITPLFMDELTKEFEVIQKEQIDKQKERKLNAFQTKLASLSFLDPAAGSGNFLTFSYISLRRLENKVIRSLLDLRKGQLAGQVVMFGTVGDYNPIKVSIKQFYGIEINDFAVTVAKTALWIAESQMMKETENIILMPLDFLPLKTNANIIEGNALKLAWEDIIKPSQLSYIIGNPPFLGYSVQSPSQKEDLKAVSNGISNVDYVAGWYFKAADYIKNTNIKCAFVSTNSITQGEQVATIWKSIIPNIEINFAYRTFKWSNEANDNAHVYCVIIGFSEKGTNKDKIIYEGEKAITCKNINPYLIDAENILIEKISKPICNCSQILKGSMPNDNKGKLSNYSTEEKNDICKKYPEAENLFKQIYGAEEYIHNKERWCLWLKDISPSVYNKIPPIMDAVKSVYDARKASNRAATQKLANTPYLFGEIRQPETGNYILVPRHSSENRRYIPFGFVSSDIIASDACNIIPNASLYEFGILCSNVHMAWMRTVSGRLEMRYRYSPMLTYNTFPWPEPSKEQKRKIEDTAQNIIKVREQYTDCSLADLYNPLTMPQDLQIAHSLNDKAVMQAYGISIKDTTEADCVAALMKMYQELTR